MPTYYFAIGERWSNMTVVRIYRPDVQEGAIHEEGGGPRTYRLRCDCGYEFELLAAAFPGKKSMRNCGRVEACEYARKEAQAREDGLEDARERQELKEERRAKRKAKKDAADAAGRPWLKGAVGRPALDLNAAINLYLPVRCLQSIKDYADKRGVIISRAAADLIDYGTAYLSQREEVGT